MRKIYIALVLIMLIFGGCGIETPQNSAGITASPTVTNTPKPTATVTITPEPTASATVTPEPTPIPIVDNYKLSGDSVILRSGLTISELESYFKLTQSELIQKLGNGYEFIGSGPGGREFCVNEELGLGLFFELDLDNLDNSTLWWVYCHVDKLELNGLTPDMDFEQIQERIGKGKIINNDHPEDGPTYDLTYEFGNFKLVFFSSTEDAKDGYWVAVCPVDVYDY